MITPVIGERYADTARDLGSVTHLDRFRAAREQKVERYVERVDLMVRLLKPTALRTGATITDLERATAAGVEALTQGRSRGYALAIARRALRDRPSA